MQIRPFEGFNNSLIILGVLAWLVNLFTYMQIRLFYFTLNAYLNNNNWGNSEINAVVLFWFLIWIFTLVITNILQQLILITVLLLNVLWSQISYFNLNNNLSIPKSLALALQLYTPIPTLIPSKQLDVFHSFCFNALKNVIMFFFFFCLAF